MIEFRTVRDEQSGEEIIEAPLAGRWLLGHPLFNKGSAFTEEERHELDLLGLVPPHVSTIEEQLIRTYANYQLKTSDTERYIFLSGLQDRNETLYYRLLQAHIADDRGVDDADHLHPYRRRCFGTL
jgi:malate dehydrogenase (oxaloacetate-decarboxylating)